jgi:hypothetical protein
MSNPHCPDYASHEENVAEQMGIAGAVPADLVEEFDARVLSEYRACEGH